MTALIDEMILNPSAVVEISDDSRTHGVRKEDRLDATTKRHYNYGTIYEWDERKRVANLEKHGLDFARADLVFESERRAYNAAIKNR